MGLLCDCKTSRRFISGSKGESSRGQAATSYTDSCLVGVRSMLAVKLKHLQINILKPIHQRVDIF